MQVEPAERRRLRDRGRRGESGQSRAEPRETQQSAGRNSEEQLARFIETFAVLQRQRENPAGGRRRRAEREDEEVAGEPGGRDRSRGGGGRGREREGEAASGGSDKDERSESLRRRANQLEKEKLELTSSHNQELCRLQAELTRLRSSVERGEAQRVELQYQLTVSQRDTDRAVELSRDKETLTEKAAELCMKVQELQRALEITRQARAEDQHALQQEVEERDRLIQSFSSENQRLHRLLQDQEEALEESERRLMEILKEKEKEAEVNRRQADELKYVTEREERSRREKELSDQRARSLESSIEAERASHLESKFNSEVVQLRMRDVEAALAVERSGHQEAQSSLELLRAQFREVERAYNMERERSGSTEHALERLQKEHEQCKSDLNVALETERKLTSELKESLEEEMKRHAGTQTLLEQASRRLSGADEAFVTFVTLVRETLQQHSSTDSSPPAEDDGNMSPSAEVLQLLKTTLSGCRQKQTMTDKQVEDLITASERLREENETLRRLSSDQSRHAEELTQKSITLGEEVTRLLKESSDWSMQNQGLKAELEKERRERVREREEREKERERGTEEREREREREKEEKMTQVQKIMEHYEEESKVRLSFLYRLYQRLLAGCVLLDQPQSILGTFTWEELCDVISEQVDQLTSDLQTANNKIAHLQSECKKRSVCVRELQRSQQCVLSRLEESVKRREEAWSRQHVTAVTQLQDELQLCRSQCDSLRDHASSLELRLSSMTSDLSRSHEESASFLSACALLVGALRHAHRRLLTLCTQKSLLIRRLKEREELEDEVRRLADALGGEEEEEEKRRRSRAVRRWRRSLWVVVAVRRWCELANQKTVLFRVERGGGAAVGVDVSDKDGVEGVCARWLRSERLSSIILSSVSDLQGALDCAGSSSLDVISAARLALSLLLDQLLDQSDGPPSLSPGRVEDKESNATNMKALVSTLQQHFLLFSQRLHSAEVERRSLRLEVSNLRRGSRRERRETSKTVPADRFVSVCEELRQALSREQEAQALLQEQRHALNTLQQRASTHSEQSDTQATLRESKQSLSQAQQQVRERSLRILGKHLSGVQEEKKQLEKRLQQMEEQLRNMSSCEDCLSRITRTAETSIKEVSEIPKASPLTDLDTPQPVPLPGPSKELPVFLNSAPSKIDPSPLQQSQTPLSPLCKNPRAKRKEKKAVKKTRAGRK
ncbi:coiled-coil domain-containing protein 171-like isoform X2 [Cheilinus undulatus]|uniref:coiled-coil domain-containing protein 171-like isoform X2 n=1 Tax=Cheilinus undulatus TaxID=241271 RepID=UPI001BD1C701|nr:coiled-coil domain-containing protein 171-like isoform X2 [Cheilinus undulatus]